MKVLSAWVEFATPVVAFEMRSGDGSAAGLDLYQNESKTAWVVDLWPFTIAETGAGEVHELACHILDMEHRRRENHNSASSEAAAWAEVEHWLFDDGYASAQVLIGYSVSALLYLTIFLYFDSEQKDLVGIDEDGTAAYWNPFGAAFIQVDLDCIDEEALVVLQRKALTLLDL